MTWGDFLSYLTHPDGVAAAVGILASWLVDYWPWFVGLSPKGKRLVFLGISLAIPGLAAALGCLTLDWPLSWTDTFWPALWAGLTAFGAGTALHLKVRNEIPV